MEGSSSSTDDSCSGDGDGEGEGEGVLGIIPSCFNAAADSKGKC